MPSEEPILEDEFLYDGEVPTRVRITRQPFTPGTGDREDLSEVADDWLEPSFRIDWSEPGRPAVINAQGGAFATLEEAKASAEALAPGLTWKAKP